MNTPVSRTFVSQRLRLHYLNWGNPRAPCLVLVHGGRDHCHSWDPLAARLCDEWRVIAPDLRGHGDSQWSTDGNYSKLAYLYDLAELIRQCARAPVNIIGHSLGADITLRYAAVFPHEVAKVVAIEGMMKAPAADAARAAAPITTRLREWIEDRRAIEARRPRQYATLEQAVDRLREVNPSLTDAQALRLVQWGIRRNDDGTYAWKFDPYVQRSKDPDMTPGDFASLLAAITCPTLLLYGSETNASLPWHDGRLGHFADASVLIVERAGHWPHHDQLDVCAERIRKFLRR